MRHIYMAVGAIVSVGSVSIFSLVGCALDFSNGCVGGRTCYSESALGNGGAGGKMSSVSGAGAAGGTDTLATCDPGSQPVAVGDDCGIFVRSDAIPPSGGMNGTKTNPFSKISDALGAVTESRAI